MNKTALKKDDFYNHGWYRKYKYKEKVKSLFKDAQLKPIEAGKFKFYYGAWPSGLKGYYIVSDGCVIGRGLNPSDAWANAFVDNLDQYNKANGLIE